MEHYRSTFAVTGIAVLGLVAAAGILHPGHFERTARAAARPMVATQTAWVDPPAPKRAARHRALPDVAALMEPEPMAVLPADGIMVQPVPAGLVQVAVTGRHREAAGRRKLARRAATTRQAALDAPGPAGQGVAPQPGTAEAPAARIDPIGDLIRGLGLGSNS